MNQYIASVGNLCRRIILRLFDNCLIGILYAIFSTSKLPKCILPSEENRGGFRLGVNGVAAPFHYLAARSLFQVFLHHSHMPIDLAFHISTLPALISFSYASCNPFRFEGFGLLPIFLFNVSLFVFGQFCRCKFRLFLSVYCLLSYAVIFLFSLAIGRLFLIESLHFPRLFHAADFQRRISC